MQGTCSQKPVDACNGRYVITYLCSNLQLQADSNSNNKVYTHNVICQLTAFGRTAHRTGNWIPYLPFARYLPMSGIWIPHQNKTKIPAKLVNLRDYFVESQHVCQNQLIFAVPVLTDNSWCVRVTLIKLTQNPNCWDQRCGKPLVSIQFILFLEAITMRLYITGKQSTNMRVQLGGGVGKQKPLTAQWNKACPVLSR